MALNWGHHSLEGELKRAPVAHGALLHDNAARGGALEVRLFHEARQRPTHALLASVGLAPKMHTSSHVLTARGVVAAHQPASPPRGNPSGAARNTTSSSRASRGVPNRRPPPRNRRGATCPTTPPPPLAAAANSVPP
eukprot:CAMPEP_0176336854 /NCGR_PEP_ID=MMETSP0121_2-20121125/79332_1 /TAXON_ID=160619 /ORGANISM="Kryptoperidinium foliaceum, Strain CCMP 1326" /LENGTH=136 /DNA_ID=CAMNT_0017679847 /DNA_START=128 /DNA_END=537 /DNA_ORIENTATION=-